MKNPLLIMKFTGSQILMLCIGVGLFFESSAQTNIPTGGQTPAPTTAVPVYTQSAYNSNAPVNYVRTWQPQIPVTSEVTLVNANNVDQIRMVSEYLDGLGRNVQTVNWQNNPSKKDLVKFDAYDANGRESYKFLPYTATTNDGSFQINPFADQNTFFNSAYPSLDQPSITGEKYFYSKTIYEASPLDRITKSFAPGNSWVGTEAASSEHSESKQYLLNDANDNIQIWSITSNNLTYLNNDVSTNIPVSSGVYGPQTLYKNVDVDENGIQTVKYMDMKGKIVLKKVQIGTVAATAPYTNWLCTYYVFDDLGQLRFVIPPKAVAVLIAAGNWTLDTYTINELCFRYEYDNRQRTIAKKIPGSAWSYYVNDLRNRQVFSQNGNLRNGSQWIYTLYDNVNRAVQTGMMNSYAGNRDALQTYVNGLTDGSGTVTVSGNGPQANPATLDISTREAGRTSYTAGVSIFFENGFKSEPGAVFTAQILSQSGGSFTNPETVNTTPFPPGITTIPLTVTNYDNYSATSKVFNSSNNSKLDAGTNIYGDPLPATASTMTTAMITSTRTRVLEDPANLSTGAWLETTSFYDDKGRVIQVQSDNYKGGIDIITNRYNFTGEAICSYQVHNNISGNITNFRIKTNNNYDNGGRLVTETKQINDDNTTTRTVSKNIYDALGKVKENMIGQKSPSNTAAMEDRTLSMNIRGWLKGINWNYPGSGSNPTSLVNPLNAKWFGMDLSYDWGYGTNQFNTNIAGIQWMCGGDGALRSLGFGYDYTNRLMFGDFKQNFGSGWSNSDPGSSNFNIDYTVKMGDGINVTTAYDENGNIKQLQQKGLIVNASPLIDNLSYAYFTNSNKLSSVTDAVTVNNQVGDFTDNNISGSDYGYDMNGNLITDKNKRINGTTGIDLSPASGAITYNFMNLPSSVAIQNTTGVVKGTVTFIYDAIGNKLEKRTDELPSATNSNTEILTTTSFIRGFIYINNVLQLFEYDYGRIRALRDGNGALLSYVNDYFLKDHQSNVREVLTEEQEQDIYPAVTLEGTITSSSSASYIENGYYTIDPSKIVPQTTATGITAYVNNNGVPNNNPNSNTTANSANLYMLNGTGTGQTGLGITLKVMAGDKIDIYGKSYYFQNIASTTPFDPVPLAALISGLFGTPSGIATASHFSSTIVSGNTLGVTNQLTVMQTSHQNAGSTTTPKAFINYIVFDDHFKVVSTNFDQVGTANIVKDYTADPVLHNIQISKNGYIYVFCSNESPVNVFFDNLQVIHTRGPLLEETSYYPFGLTMAGISSKALKTNYVENKFKFQKQELQNNEFSDGSGLEMYEFKYRFDDCQIGRFWSIDPLADKYVHNSTYAFSENKVTTHIELEGKEAAQIFQQAEKELADNFQALADKIDHALSYFNKSSNSTPVLVTPIFTTSVGSTITINTSTNAGGFMSYLINHNTLDGYSGPLTTTTIKTTADTKTEATLGGVKVSNKTSVSPDGVVTNEVMVKTNVVIEGVPATVGAGASNSSNGQATVTGQVSTNIPGSVAQGTVQAQYSKDGNQQSLSLGVGGETKIGKTTTSTLFGFRFAW
jgi:Domain of unknown function (DUF6443)